MSSAPLNNIAILSAHHLTKNFGGFCAVDDASLAVRGDEIVGLIGPNGAGKSTVFALLTGFIAPTRGRVALDGEDITHLLPHRRASKGIARTFQVPREFGDLSVRENLMAAAPGQAGESLSSLFLRPARVRAQEAEVSSKAEETASFLKLTRVLDQPAAKLSGGQKKLLEMGRALMTNPRLILLDEPFAGVNPVLIGDIIERIREMNAKGIGFLIVEHDLPSLSKLATTLHVMDRGRVIASGPPSSVLSEASVREAYLGGVAA